MGNFNFHFILISALISLIGFFVGCIIYKLTFFIPHTLQNQWRIQSWQCLYPYQKLPTEISIIEKTKPLRSKYCWMLAFATAFLSLFIICYFGLQLKTGAYLILTWGLVLLACIDSQYYLLPDCLTFPLLWLGLICNTLGWFVPIREAVWGAIVGYLSLWSIALLFKFCRGKEGIGQGDFKLLAVFGAWWGLQPLFFIVLFASLTGASVGLIQIARGAYSLQKPLPFGPFLILGGLIVMFYNPKLMDILC